MGLGCLGGFVVPVVADFEDRGGGESMERSLIGEYCGDGGASLVSLVRRTGPLVMTSDDVFGCFRTAGAFRPRR